MFKYLRKKINSDRGDSTLVSTILVIPLIIGIFFTTVDVSIFFSDRGQLLNIVRDGARQVAIFGGDGTATQATPLEKAYGQTRASACSGLSGMPAVKDAFKTATSTAVECKVLKNIARTQGLIGINITAIQCGAATNGGTGDFTVSKTSAVGQQVGCTLTWRYDGIPGSGLSFLNRAKSMGYGSEGIAEMGHVTRVNTTSEVNMSGIPLQNW